MNKIIPNGDVLISEKALKQRVHELGVQLTNDYHGKKLLLVSVLKGCVVFLADLMREISLPLEIDFMCVSSYGNSTTSNGSPIILKDLNQRIDDYDVLIVEDIIDSGNTLSYLYKELSRRNPNSLKICTLLDKPSRRTADIDADYVGFTIDDYFIVGYGLDYAEKFRNQKYISICQQN